MVKAEMNLFISTLSWIALFGRHGTSWYQTPGAPTGFLGGDVLIVLGL